MLEGRSSSNDYYIHTTAIAVGPGCKVVNKCLKKIGACRQGPVAVGKQ